MMCPLKMGGSLTKTVISSCCLGTHHLRIYAYILKNARWKTPDTHYRAFFFSISQGIGLEATVTQWQLGLAKLVQL